MFGQTPGSDPRYKLTRRPLYMGRGYTVRERVDKPKAPSWYPTEQEVGGALTGLQQSYAALRGPEMQQARQTWRQRLEQGGPYGEAWKAREAGAAERGIRAQARGEQVQLGRRLAAQGIRGGVGEAAKQSLESRAQTQMEIARQRREQTAAMGQWNAQGETVESLQRSIMTEASLGADIAGRIAAGILGSRPRYMTQGQREEHRPGRWASMFGAA